jgi:hypothetical protein
LTKNLRKLSDSRGSNWQPEENAEFKRSSSVVIINMPDKARKNVSPKSFEPDEAYIRELAAKLTDDRLIANEV